MKREKTSPSSVRGDIFIVIDRLIKKDYSDSESNDTKRLKDSINLAYKI
ncbi:MAG: hypothetical protein LBQ59_02910 [Candidatus Peribacteria bacterium]|nr:hypothetical protein [Candidatus Peribacteria bacterium]